MGRTQLHAARLLAPQEEAHLAPGSPAAEPPAAALALAPLAAAAAAAAAAQLPKAPAPPMRAAPQPWRPYFLASCIGIGLPEARLREAERIDYPRLCHMSVRSICSDAGELNYGADKPGGLTPKPGYGARGGAGQRPVPVGPPPNIVSEVAAFWKAGQLVGLLKQAGRGNAAAQCYAALTADDAEESRSWLLKSARSGFASAQVLATAEFFGTLRESGEAWWWLNRAAAKGHPHADFVLGTFFEFEMKHTHLAAMYYHSAAKLGLDVAARALWDLAYIIDPPPWLERPPAARKCPEIWRGGLRSALFAV